MFLLLIVGVLDIDGEFVFVFAVGFVFVIPEMERASGEGPC